MTELPSTARNGGRVATGGARSSVGGWRRWEPNGRAQPPSGGRRGVGVVEVGRCAVGQHWRRHRGGDGCPWGIDHTRTLTATSPHGTPGTQSTGDSPWRCCCGNGGLELRAWETGGTDGVDGPWV